MRIIPVLYPSDLGRSARGQPADTGLRGAPDVLLDLLEEQGVRFGRPVTIPVPSPEADPEGAHLKFEALHVEASATLAEAVADINAEANFPLILGGDHSALFGHVLGHSLRHPEGIGLAVLADPTGDLEFPAEPIFDSDRKRLRTDPEVTSTGEAARMALSGVLGRFPESMPLAERLSQCAVDGEQTSVVGLRGPETAQLRKIEKVTQLELWRMERLELDGEQAYRSMLERHLSRGPIALSIDVRGVDPGLLSAVNDPVSDGLDWSFIKRSLEQCLPHVDRILGLDICEFDPSHDSVHSVGQVRLAETLAPFLRKIVR
ncbi:MAG: arginase family protein [Myxococcota bacterium]